MAIEKYAKPSMIFDPVPSYDGDWVFAIGNLIRNAKKEKGVNLFIEFYLKTYGEPLMKIFHTKNILDFGVGMVCSPNSNNIGRTLKYCKVDFFVGLSLFLASSIDKYGYSEEEFKEHIRGLLNFHQSNEELNTIFSEELKEKAKRLKDVMDNEINSVYFDAANEDYTRSKSTVNFSTYIKEVFNLTVDLEKGMLDLGDFFEKSIDYNEMAKAFDPDVFYTLFLKIIYEFNKEREKDTGHLDASFNYYLTYKNISDEVIKEDKDYNPKVLFTNKDGKKEMVTRRSIQRDMKAMLERHNDFAMISLPALEDDDKYRDINLINKIQALYNDETKLNWEFLPKGEGIKKHRENANSSPSNNPSHDKNVLDVNMRIEIIENSGFIGEAIKGLNTFNGYYAFVYPNGKVVLEKFWENEEEGIPAVDCATYVMNIDNFIEMSKMSKISLIELIKTLPEIGVKRIFHTTINNWQRNLYNEINGLSYRLEDVIEFIGSLNGALKNE